MFQDSLEECVLVVQWLTNQVLTPVVQGRFPVRENMYLLFNSDTVYLVWHINWREKQKT